MTRQSAPLFRLVFALWAACTLVALPHVAAAAPAAPGAVTRAAGDEFWDDRFGLPGTTSTVYDAAVAADGSVYASVDERTVLRWNGRGWQSLGETSNGFIYAIATIDNTAYVAGSFTNIGMFPVKYLAKWTGSAWEQVGDGTGPQTVEPSGTSEGEFSSLAGVNGTLYVGGRFTKVDGVEAFGVAAWNGSAWSALGGGIRNLDFEEQPTETGNVATIVPAGGKLYVGGTFDMAGSARAGSIAVWDGSAWNALGGSMLQDNGFGFLEPGKVEAIAVAGGKVYAGGQFSKAGSTNANNIAAWNGTAWAALGSGITGDPSTTMGVHALLADGAGVLAGGEFNSAGGTGVSNIARWNGTAWQAAAQLERDSYITALVATPGGYYIAGSFDSVDGVLSENIALRTGEEWQAIGQGLTANDNNCCQGNVYAIANDGAGHVYVGGRFKTAGGVTVNNIAVWDGARWSPLGAGVGEGDVRALLLLGDELYVGGTFKTAGGAAISYVALYNTTSGEWSALGSGVNGDVYTLEEADGVLYVGGDMSSAGGVKVSNIAAWDGANWSALSQKLVIRQIFDNCSEAGSQVYAIKASGRYLVIAGSFAAVQVGFAKPCLKESYFPANNILLWDRVADEWSFLGGNGSYGVSGGDVYRNSVKALEVVGGALDAGGAVYVGGEFGQAGAVPARGLARFTLQRGWETPSGVSGGTSGVLTYPGVSALKAAGSDLYVGGNFSTAGTGPANYVARYNTANGAWAALGSGADRNVAAIDVAPDGLYIGGEFGSAGGKPAASFSRYGVPISTGNVTPEGGTVTGDGVSISFPAGAVSGSTTVIFSPMSAPAHGVAPSQGVARAFRFEAKGPGGQPVTQFAQPYTLHVSYTDQMLAAAGIEDPMTLTLAYWNGSSWVSMLPCQGCGVDTTNKAVTVVANHFTEFALIGTANTKAIFIPLARR